MWLILEVWQYVIEHCIFLFQSRRILSAATARWRTGRSAMPARQGWLETTLAATLTVYSEVVPSAGMGNFLYLFCWLVMQKGCDTIADALELLSFRWLNSLAPGRFEWNFKQVIFKLIFSGWWLRYSLWNYPQVILIGTYWWQVNIGSGNGLVPSGNKPLPEPMLTQIYVAQWHHQATMS